jgi:hypothetical protein
MSTVGSGRPHRTVTPVQRGITSAAPSGRSRKRGL